ncbi:MAG TPA: cytochrome, partial [Aldersonia sp.]
LVGEARSGNGTYHGTCSNYLFEQDTDRVVHAFVRDTSSSFRLPTDPSTPVLMIGSGTGMAPFRGFLQERMALKQNGTRVGPALLVFGCRHPQSDQLYGDELAQLADAADVQLACAYSRVAGLPRVYVQDRLRQLGEQVMSLIDDGAVGYVCGATAMADGVRDALIEMRAASRGEDSETAATWVQQLVTDGRWLVDVWATG